jgi:hypothetical protein
MDELEEDDSEVDMDAVALGKLVQESIKKDLDAGSLDLTIVVSPEAGDDGINNDDAEGNKEDQQKDSGENGDVPPGDNQGDQSSDVHVPKVAIWYQNAIMNKLWEDADPSQIEAVEQMNNLDEGEGEMVIDEMEDDEKKTKRLRGMMRFVMRQ